MYRIYPAPKFRDLGVNSVFLLESDAAAEVRNYFVSHDIEYEVEEKEVTVIAKVLTFKDKDGQPLAKVDLI